MGHTQNLNHRLLRHSRHASKATKRADVWKLVFSPRGPVQPTPGL
ncbi:MAG: hypothetical protein ACK4E8_07825 [Lacibacter sp.]